MNEIRTQDETPDRVSIRMDFDDSMLAQTLLGEHNKHLHIVEDALGLRPPPPIAETETNTDNLQLSGDTDVKIEEATQD